MGLCEMLETRGIIGTKKTKERRDYKVGGACVLSWEGEAV